MLEDYIHQQLDEPLTTGRLAEIANVSPGHFHELFRRAKGMTPGQYLLSVRMYKAGLNSDNNCEVANDGCSSGRSDPSWGGSGQSDSLEDLA